MRSVLRFNLRLLFLAVLAVCLVFGCVRYYLDRAESQRAFAQWCTERNATVIHYCEANHFDTVDRKPEFLERYLGIDAVSSISAILGLEISNITDAEHLCMRLRTKTAPILVLADFAHDIPVDTQELFVGIKNFDGCIGRLPHKHGNYRPFIRDGVLTSKFPYEERPEYIERMKNQRQNETAHR